MYPLSSFPLKGTRRRISGGLWFRLGPRRVRELVGECLGECHFWSSRYIYLGSMSPVG